MWYLFTQMWLWILFSFALGWVAHWYYSGRRDQTQTDATQTQAQPFVAATTPSTTSAASPVAPEPAPISEEAEVSQPQVTSEKEEHSEKPSGFSQEPEAKDNLKRIKGIGAVNEKALNDLGIYQFSQIAQWTPENIKWVEGSLAFPGRIGREDWVSQAKTLADEG
ncbi:hypothetical protein [Halioxenophilus aromaticivorans]|uniref:Uncharacterized protein n=1 Tax=Halioxenophilus aromaticivorans TaxID=1306992 RepID=A0AAV3U9E9_9ALTE